MVVVDTLIEDARWREIDLESRAEKVIVSTLSELEISTKCSVSLLACNDARIAGLNGDFRGAPRPTNVLSWPGRERGAAKEGDMPDMCVEEGEEVGDIAIAYETIAREAVDFARSFEAHVTHLLVHGTLHLLGFDHTRDGDATLMEKFEIRILESLGVDNPY